MADNFKPLHKKQKRIQKQYIKQKVWQQMDDLQQKLYGQSEDQGEKKNRQNRNSAYIKPDRSRKISQIKEYEDALVEHRKKSLKFCDPFKTKQIILNIDIEKTIKSIQQARWFEKDVPGTLRSLGLKRLKILFKCGANQHFQSVINYLTRRTIPEWMKMKHQQLMQRQY